MLTKQSGGDLVAVCEECEEESAPVGPSREIAMLRLMRLGWRLRTEADGEDRTTRTWCPACMTMPSIPALKING